ncbi:putative methyltransferase-domain-containing protein [Xylaria arbuscula]|nr:putative methyltransferase-domain-containing protein [Xylaria arbuscula]
MTKDYRDISPADYPQVWQKPSFEDLLACLKQLRIEPQIWGPGVPKKAVQESQENNARARREVTAYLASIVSNALKWLGDDDQREIIWDEASRRLSERCGRAGMGEMTRRWPFQDRRTPFELIVREPPITGDSLGHKTWASSYFMAQLLDSFTNGCLAHLLGPDRRDALKILELGSGTGLLGLAAAASWEANVILSDLPDIMSNLDHNIKQNRATIEQLGGSISSGVLVWGSEGGNDPIFSVRNQFDIILAADSLYDDNHPELLSSAIHDQLSGSLDSRAVVMVPQRDKFTKELTKQFRSIMNSGPLALEVLAEHSLTGQDDWEGDDDESSKVECWWAVFGRRT